MRPEDMKDETLYDILNTHTPPEHSKHFMEKNIAESLKAFEKEQQKKSATSQGFGFFSRLMGINNPIGDLTMKKLYVAGGVATLGIAAFALTNTSMLTQFAPHDVQEITGHVSSNDAPKEEITSAPTEEGRLLLNDMEADSIAPLTQATTTKVDQKSPSMPNQAKSSVGAGGIAAAPQAEKAKAKRMQSFGAIRELAPHMIHPSPTDVVTPHYREEGRDQFTDIDDSPVKVVSDEPVSTFSIDVDTSSYSFMRRQLNNGVLPQPDSVRIEELVNYFDYDYALPASKDEPFKPTVAVYDTPWNDDTQLLHIGIKGHDIVPDEKPRSNLVFLIDSSGSMSSPDKLPLLLNGFKLMVENLDDEDTVAIATYAGSAGVVLEPTKVKDKQKILSALSQLQSGGSTAGAAGIKLAYQLAEQHFDEDAVNRVMLATDGDFNVGITNQEELKGYIERQRESGIFLSILGFGQGNYNDALMQTLAQNGNGTAAYIDSLSEARKVLVEEASSTLFPIAKDVKIQVEFNPAKIAEYRLIGYRTRILNREDFNNDKVDAGEIGAGHAVTAIYEVTPTDSNMRQVDSLRYRKAGEAKIKAKPSAEYAFLKLRYKLPEESKSKLIERPITNADQTELTSASADIRFAASVAAFGQKLRGGTYLGEFGYDDIIKLAQGAKGDDAFGYRAEFINLVRLAKSASKM